MNDTGENQDHAESFRPVQMKEAEAGIEDQAGMGLEEGMEPETVHGVPCERCQGSGRVREWSNFFAIAAVGGFGAAGYLAWQAMAAGTINRPSIRFIVLLCCVGVFGLYGLLDRGDCKQCSGMGILEPAEDQGDSAEEEWAQSPPPE